MNPNDEYIIIGYLKSGDISFREQVQGDEVLNMVTRIRNNRFKLKEFGVVRVTIDIAFVMMFGEE